MIQFPIPAFFGVAIHFLFVEGFKAVRGRHRS
jgi:hypothetical protein